MKTGQTHVTQQEEIQPKASLPKAFYNVREVCQVTGLGRTTIHRLMSANAFVKKVQLSPGRVAFRVADVTAWIDAREQVAA